MPLSALLSPSPPSPWASSWHGMKSMFLMATLLVLGVAVAVVQVAPIVSFLMEAVAFLAVQVVADAGVTAAPT
eukprot:CAMPEP_0201916888 /NCGR_PEP_ID=MMETSP0903-20130614/6409_1 /ASSEMBLY_ACC=CAM_ASM_000552 /TAXON_ID=420261 /ORGANISM="Thalassiosira antarctica, Strain CCMP982" /LENGTH=72 /DNA_ID=CAMNT_0048452817 /DNA_START=59 /DNA_END=273 /DNA_ORIENTATION=+